MRLGIARPILTPEQMRDWQRDNMEAFDRLPAEVRYALRSCDIEADCKKLESAMALGVSEQMVIDAILARAKPINQRGV